MGQPGNTKGIIKQSAAKIQLLFIFIMIIPAACNKAEKDKIYFIGERIENRDLVVLYEYTSPDENVIYRKVMLKSDTNTIFYTDGKNNMIFFYVKYNVDNGKLKRYLNFFEEKFSSPPQYIEGGKFSGSFICNKYLWKDSIQGDFVNISSCRNTHNKKIKQENPGWDIEVGNDTLIRHFREHIKN